MYKIIIIFAAAVLTLAAFGCAKDQATDDNMQNITIEPTAQMQTPTSETDTDIEILVTGTYVGLIDGNSFEAIIDELPMAFRHDDCESFIEDAKIIEGDSITISYTQNENGQNIAASVMIATQATISDLFPIIENVYKYYMGEGNEYAEYETIVEFTSPDKVQIKTNNSGTSTVNVYEVTDNYVKKVYAENEIYEIIDFTENVNKDEIILMMPIQVGTTWAIDSNTQRTISAVDKTITTPYSEFKAVEVKTVSDTSIIYDYYVVGIGHVMSIFEDNETKTRVTSQLQSMETSNPSK